jgi:chromosome segregation protein
VELKRLEVFGFKSFADRTRFDFDSGITVIVGPNGCGKSNVVDAVKWVLGEQSPKSLRGREMADIIFAGSESRRSLGFAEATLVFDNTRGLLPIGVTEVEVSRRLYRSGESEYMLNRKPCRLRDIRELFMDTGVGVDAYSLIEQGKVDVLLQSNPQDRRIIFEEAAGISKYKSKRREAERKLQRTEQNLLRLTDILDEVERRLRSVKYQAGKARNYVEYTQRLKELRVSYALSQYHEESQALAAHQAAIEGLELERSTRAAALAGLDQDRARAEGELMDLDNHLREIESRLSEVRSGVATRENEIGFHRTRAGELGQVVERDRRKIGDLSAHLREAQARVESCRAAQTEMADGAGRQEETVSAAEVRLAQVNDEVRVVAGRVEAAKSALMDLAQARSERSSRLAGIELRLEAVEAQTRKLQVRLEEIGAALARLAQEETAMEAEKAALEQAIAERRGRLEEKRAEAEAKQKEVEDVGERLARAKQEAAVLDSRRGLLEDLERRGEGIPAAVRQTREAIAAAGAPERWHGMVADLIEVDLASAAIIDSALGPAEKLIVADRQADVLDLARRLEGQLPGQVRFLALDAMQPVSNGKDLSAYPEAVGWAMDYVRAADSVRPAISHLLARTIVARSLEGAVELARGPLAGYRFVTLSGNVLELDGTVAVGPPGPETSLISRRSELRDLSRDRDGLDRRIEELDAHRRKAVEELRALDVDQQALRQEIYEGSMAKVEAEGRQRRVADVRRQLETESPVVQAELANLAARRDQSVAERDALQREVQDLAVRESEQLASIAAQVCEQKSLIARRETCEESRTQARIVLAQLREKQASLTDQQAAAERDLVTTRDGIAQAQSDLAECQDRIRQSERTMLRLQSELSMLFLEKETAEAGARGLVDDRQARHEAIEALAEKARELEAESDGLQQQVHERQLERRGLETKRAELVQRVRDDFGIDLAERYGQWQPEAVDWDAVAEEIKNLQGKIERLGAVNLEAIEEQDALEKRVEFLRGQRDDLTKAREALGGLIERINRESRERFMKTFEAVRGHFQELYRKLFGGGKADVFLENEADVLESGIEVVARPPGKQLQRISLLSGGEKTMTAVALLLAIFRARPSPFCILDEVDAALDESNVDRFTSLVREFLDQSQFVIITHNKRTMSIADVLYGVTMGEPGVSRKVSVKFSDMHERGYITADDKQPRRGRQPEAPPAVVAPETAAALAAIGRGQASEPALEPAAEAAGDAQLAPAAELPQTANE